MNQSRTESTASKENVKYLFKAFKAIYTHKFTSMYPNVDDLHIAMTLWTHKLASFDRPEIDAAILEVSESTDWVPTIKEFKTILKRNRANKELKLLMNKTETDLNIGVTKEQAKKNINRLKGLISDAWILCDKNK